MEHEVSNLVGSEMSSFHPKDPSHWSYSEFEAKAEMLESLKECLFNGPSFNDDGIFFSDWINSALRFVSECDNVFNSPQNAQYVKILTPNVNSQICYIRDQLQTISDSGRMKPDDAERFRHSFLISSLGFITKFKLIAYVICSNENRLN